MRDQQRGEAVLGAQPVEQRLHLQSGERVQGAERLVEQQQIRFTDQGASDRDSLGLPTGQLRGPRALAAGEAHLRQRRRRALPYARPGHAERDVLRDPLPWQQPVLLEDDRQAAGHPPVAGRVRVEAGEDAQQCGLARAAATEQRDHLAAGDRQVDAVEHNRVAEGTPDPSRADYVAVNPRRHARVLLSRMRSTTSDTRPSRA